jgi:hypothetical protein
MLALRKTSSLVLGVSVALTAAVAPALADSAAVKPAGSYVGKTAQGKKVSLKVSKGKVGSVKFRYTAKCSGNRKVANRSYSFAGGVELSGRKFTIGQGLDTEEATLKGTFNAKATTAKGSFKVNVVDPKSTAEDPLKGPRCKTGKITFSVAKKG